MRSFRFEIRRTVRAMLLLITAVTLAGCYKNRGASADDGITLEVENRNYLDVTIYAVSGGSRIRVGEVTGTGTKSFELSLRRVSPTGELQLQVDPVGSRRTWTSSSLHVFGGQTIELTVESEVTRSSYSIRG
jgi:hypothetical protein